MSQRFFFPREQVFSNLGAIGAGYKLYTFITGTSTPSPTYSNVDLDVENTNPLVANSAGRFGDIFVDDLSLYKAILSDENGPDDPTDPITPIWSTDPVNPQTFTIEDFDPRPTSFWGTTTGTSSVYNLVADPIVTQYLDTQTFFFSVHIDNLADATLTYVDGGAALDLVKSDGAGGLIPVENDDLLAGTTLIARNNGVSVEILNPQKPYLDAVNFTTFKATTTTVGVVYLTSPITTSYTNGSTVAFSGGSFQFSDGSGQRIASAWSKTTGAFAIGNNNGALDTGSVANNTFYHAYAIYNPTTEVSDYLFSASATSPTLPSGYTRYSKIVNGQFLTDGSANILSFIKQGTVTYFVNYIINYAPGSLPSGTNVALPVSVPVQSNIEAIITAFGQVGTGAGDVLTLSFEGSLQTINTAILDLDLVGDATRSQTLVKNCPTSNGNIKYTVVVATSTVYLTLATRGWIDHN